MIQVSNFPNAYKEVYTILENVREEDLKSIPKEFLDMLKKDMNNNHQFTFDINKEFKQQKILRETKAILAYIFINYWANEKQNEKIRQLFNQDIIKQENEKKKMYPSDVFSQIKDTQTNTENIVQSTKNTALMEIKNEKWYIKILNKIKKFFKLKK